MAGLFAPYGDTLTASDRSELLDKLARIDARVPGRDEGRIASERERFCIVNYLATLGDHKLLSFPLKVDKRESPDFEVAAGSETYGLEVTQAGEEILQRALTELEKAPTGTRLEIGNSILRPPGEELRQKPYFGDEPERRWTEELLRVICKKTERLKSYAPYPRHDLLINDVTGWSAATSWFVDELPDRLAAAIEAWRGDSADPMQFARISILRPRVLMYDVCGEASILPVPLNVHLPPLLPLTRLGVSEDALRAFCRRHHIRKLGFFGSVRGDAFGPESDVDVLVEFEPGQRVGFLRLTGIEEDLSQLVGRKADLRTVPDLSRYFREDVVRHKMDLAYASS